MMYRTANFAILVALSLVISCSSGTSTDGLSTSPDNYWQMTLTPEFASRGKANLFWRTHQATENVQVFDACKLPTEPAIATAVGNEDGSWSLSADFGSMTATINSPGKLTLSLDGKVFATGQRVAPLQCRGGVPLSVTEIQPGDGERSFNSISGDALHIEAARNQTLPTIRTPPPPTLPIIGDTSTTLGNGDIFACHTTPNAPAEVRTLTQVPTLGLIPVLWPGAIFQGKSYATGKFAPNTIARSGGTITLTGLNFGAGARTSASVTVMSQENVQNALNDLLSQPIKSTEAAFAFHSDVLYNADQMAYTLGVDGRFLNGLDQVIKFTPAPGRNYVLFTFIQTYYTVSFADPENTYSVFRDGIALVDPDNQVAADNPPLYVRDVGFGRTVFFLVDSPFNGNVVREALNAAADGKGDAVSSAGVTYSQILQQSNASYSVFGGDALAALGPTGQISGIQNLFEALKTAITDAKTSAVSQFSRGLPISYSLSYLTSRESASLGFGTTFNQTNCVTTPKQYASFNLKIMCIDDFANVTLIDRNNNETQVFNGGLPGNVTQYFPLDALMEQYRNDNYTLKLSLYNACGPSCLDFQLTRTMFQPSINITALNGQTGNMEPTSNMSLRILPPPPPYPVVNAAGSWACGNIVDYRIRLNRFSGDVTVTQGR